MTGRKRSPGKGRTGWTTSHEDLVPAEDDKIQSPSGAKMRTEIDPAARRILVRWACRCAGRVLPRFESERPGDLRPRKAIETARRWALGKAALGEVRASAFAAHAAARAAARAPAACAAARSAGHAAATAHVAAHAAHAAAYAAKAAAVGFDAVPDAAGERAWQAAHLPRHLRQVAFPAGTGAGQRPAKEKKMNSTKKVSRRPAKKPPGGAGDPQEDPAPCRLRGADRRLFREAASAPPGDP